MAEKVELKRALGLFEVTLSGLGIILGAGIYALLGEAAGMAGNAVWISFTLASLVALFTGLSYAEFSSIFPRASAEYVYTSHAFGRRVAFIVGWLIILSGVIGAAAVALGFSGYWSALTGLPPTPSAIGLIAVLSFILFAGIRPSALMAVVFTLIEALGLVMIIILGIPYLGTVDYFDMPFGLEGIFSAAALIFFAFIGFEEMVKLAEETRDPEKTIPKALVLAVSTSIVLYILVAVSSVSVLGWERLGESSAPFADIAGAAFGESAFFILSVIALFATTNTVLLMLLAASRIAYGMAEEGSLPQALADVHKRTRTPWVSIAAMMVLAMLFLFVGEIGFVAEVTNFTLFVTFIIINAALIVLRYREPDRPRPFKVPIAIGRMPVIPLIGMIVNFFLLTRFSFEVIAVGIVLTAVGGVIALTRR